ncbi:hypothetical protein [Amycolatopsis sp. NBC_01480]|uniref:hypothetical protein n=1 Tax=Amycolatopsis sp. NBC_01480 TaxID=2903562 RepID=UPI002E2E125E|nr:hypothetical protein [Amycolatopsis sp. NBC_01480]
MTAKFDLLIETAVRLGWRVVPQILYRGNDNALVRSSGSCTDIVTIPLTGWSTVVRLAGGPAPGDLRATGTEVWRHVVPLQLALMWVGSDADDDSALSKWDSNIWFTAAPKNEDGDKP